MKKKVTLLTCLLLSTLLIFGGCSSSEDSQKNNSGKEKKAVSEDTISVDDIDWNVDERIIDGEKCLSFNYTNNTDFTITSVELKFEQKEDVTEEQLNVFNYLVDGDVSFYNKNDLKNIYISAENFKIADAGETVEDSQCRIDNSGLYAKSIKEYEIMEPTDMTIHYVGSDDKIHTLGYNYKTNAYAKSNDIVDKYIWEENELSEMLPKPKFEFVSSYINSSGKYYFTFSGVNKNDYDKYLIDCKEKGFINDEDTYEFSWHAINSEGYKISLYYTESTEYIEGHIEKDE